MRHHTLLMLAFAFLLIAGLVVQARPDRPQSQFDQDMGRAEAQFADAFDRLMTDVILLRARATALEAAASTDKEQASVARFKVWVEAIDPRTPRSLKGPLPRHCP